MRGTEMKVKTLINPEVLNYMNEKDRMIFKKIIFEPSYSMIARKTKLRVSSVYDRWKRLEKKFDIQVVMYFEVKKDGN
jgi:DNA invertase Pin-like site-specific DNA recombinase